VGGRSDRIGQRRRLTPKAERSGVVVASASVVTSRTAVAVPEDDEARYLAGEDPDLAEVVRAAEEEMRRQDPRGTPYLFAPDETPRWRLDRPLLGWFGWRRYELGCRGADRRSTWTDRRSTWTDRRSKRR
jgi:hypothetical protein